ncbi:MAG TPA: Ig-like domain-containing protein [Candidatus Wunengus sp. YC63]|uniref:Ig-like domain-containing protein n=1 Tax=Candidatus Wunengus sp. YC63 TaxID=3367699 RepID=UPI0040261280
MSGVTFSYDEPCEDCEIPPYPQETKAQESSSKIKKFNATTGKKVWTKQVNSGCQYSDHYITIDIDVKPEKIKDPKIELSLWDVDYNDPQKCENGPEVDYLYINGNKIGQLTGANNSWSVNQITISSSYLKEGSNQIYIDTDAPGTGCWCVGVGYVQISGNVEEFSVVTVTPEDDKHNVNWANPNITIEFNSEVDTATADGNIFLYYRDEDGNQKKEPFTLKYPTSTKVEITPDSSLKDGIRYYMRVQSGVKNKNGDELKSDKEWSFWTMVNLDGKTTEEYPPNDNKDKLQITWFNVCRNEDLVKGKTVVNRIYILWDKKDEVYDEDEVEEFEANITLEVNGTIYEKTQCKIKRPDKYEENDKRYALNTINFDHGGSLSSKEEYTLKVEPFGQSDTPVKVFEKTASATVRNKMPTIEFNFYACEMAGWYGGVNPGEIADAKDTLSKGQEFTWFVFPILGCRGNDKGTIKSGSGGFGILQYAGIKYSNSFENNVRFVKRKKWFGLVEEEKEEILVVKEKLETLLPFGHRFIVGLIPKDGLYSTTNGITFGNKVILFPQEIFKSGTVAHEIGHTYDISVSTGSSCSAEHNNIATLIEGFNVYEMTNKSFREGNSDVVKFNHKSCSGVEYETSVVPVMNMWTTDAKYHWIRPDDYKYLLDEVGGGLFSLTEKAILSTGTQSSAVEFMVVQGYIDKSDNIEDVLPLYNVTQRHIDAPSGSGYTAELFSEENGTGTSLGAYDFNTDDMTIHNTDGTFETLDSQMFAFTIPFDGTASSLVIKGTNNTVIINKSDHGTATPTADFAYPADGDTLSGTVDITWSGSDDGGTVYYGLEYSSDGTNWMPISNRMTDIATYSIDTTLLPTGANQKLALIASDGFQTTRKEISITIDNYVKVSSTSPLNNETDVSELQAEINAYFVSDLDESTINTDSFKLFEGSKEIGGTVSYDSDTRMVAFRPTSNFNANTTYTAQLVAGKIKDTRGNTLESNYEWSFTTGKRLINPQVDSVSPSKGAMNVPINVIIQATFENDVDSNTVGSSTFTLKDNNDTAVAGTVSYNAAAKGALFTPSSNLATSTTYVATLTTAIADSDGLQLESDYAWSFTTGSEQYNGVRIIKVDYDQAEDTNDDGLYDKLTIRFQVEVATTGTYNLNCQLVDKNGEDIEWTSKTQSFSTKGVYSVDLEFDGAVIASHAVDGPFEATNIYIYNTSSTSIKHSFENDYRTYPYLASKFYSKIKLSDIPEIAVASDSTNDDVINLENYASHVTYNVTDLTYKILTNSNSDAGVSMDTSHKLDINPTTGFSGYGDVTVQVKDNDGYRALDTFGVSVLKSYKFANAGWYLISLTSQPVDTNITTVLSPLAGKYKTVWNYSDGAWKVYYPDNPGFSDLSAIEAGKGYWIEMKEAANFSTKGSTVGGQSLSLVKGWNLVGLNSTESITPSDAFASIAGRYLSVWAYIDGVWKSYDPNNAGASDLTTIEPGYGYWIKAIMDTTWTLP